MNDYNLDFTFLTEEQLEGANSLDIFKKIGLKAPVTDYAILHGAYLPIKYLELYFGNDFMNRLGLYWTKTPGENVIKVIDWEGQLMESSVDELDIGCRPVVKYSEISDIAKNKKINEDGILEIEYGEYPQFVILDDAYDLTLKYLNKRLEKTGKTYTFDFKRKYEEYIYNNKKYILVTCDSELIEDKAVLSDTNIYENGEKAWIKVEPIKWLVDEKSDLAISEKILFSGKPYNYSRLHSTSFEESDIESYLNLTFANDIKPSLVNNIEYEKLDKSLDYSKLTTEETVKLLLESNIPVFLHGQSGEGKNQIVKDIVFKYDNFDSDYCYLPLNKEIFTDKHFCKDGIPTWLQNINKINDFSKLKVIFIDNFSMASKEVVNRVFNLINDRSYTYNISSLAFVGDCNLPPNARIVVSSNETEEIMDEKIYSLFAHVNVEIPVEKWLETASKDNVHPIILAYVACNKDRVLRTKYDGKHPNVNPSRWYLVSDVLKNTKNIELLNTILGDNLAKYFYEFCNSKVITLDQVLYSNYLPEYDLTEKEKYATLVGLSEVDGENVEIVRRFVRDNLGKDLVTIFDIMWAKGNEDRLELLEEIKNQEQVKKRTLLK